MIQNRKFIQKIMLFPKKLIFLIFFISFLGLLLMYDASMGHFGTIAKKQLLYFLLFLPVMFLIALIDIRILFNCSYYIYALSLCLLLLGTVLGYKAMGATRWINLGFIRFQPSELMKIGVILAVARYFHSIDDEQKNKLSLLTMPIIMAVIPLIVILKQPDLGTALVLVTIVFVIFFLVGVRIWKFAIVAVAGLSASPFIWNHLHDYQKKRILIFLDPERDPLGAGYNIIQSKIAVGSGGIWGKGRMESTQAKLDFLPEHHTDFIFSLFAEEFGFVGGVILLISYLFIILDASFIGTNCKNTFGKLAVFGLITIFSTHVFMNLGMVIGLLPVVGIPLPLLSSGGTAMGATMIAFGIIINIHLNYNERIPRNKLGYLS